jgi:hypothetical protein
MESVYSRGIDSVPNASSSTFTPTPSRQRSASASATSRATGPSS